MPINLAIFSALFSPESILVCHSPGIPTFQLSKSSESGYSVDGIVDITIIASVISELRFTSSAITTFINAVSTASDQVSYPGSCTCCQKITELAGPEFGDPPNNP